MDPLVFEPFARPMVWGGRRLETLLGKKLPTSDRYGESWEISAHPLHVSKVMEGSHAGETLIGLCQKFQTELLGTQIPPTEGFPLLIKYLDCQQLLSIQVHPNDEQVTRLSGEKNGKTEAWIVLAVDPTAKIFAGFLPGIGERDVRAHLQTGTLEQCLHSFVPQVGDCLFLEAGTVHAVGGGVVLAEVQQSSDATFRLFDWNRVGTDGKPRPLHIEQALQCIDWNRGPVNPEKIWDLGPPNPHTIEAIVTCPYFAIDRVQGGGRYIPVPGKCRIGMVLRGRAELATNTGYHRVLKAGETVLVPASAHGPEWYLHDAELLNVIVGERW